MLDHQPGRTRKKQVKFYVYESITFILKQVTRKSLGVGISTFKTVINEKDFLLGRRLFLTCEVSSLSF